MPLLGADPDLASFLSSYPQTIPRPSAILVVSAHWLTSSVSVTSHFKHPLLFDYSGFPPETYKYTYPAPGSPDLAGQICNLLSAENISCRQEVSRGWDHGVFVPLLLMYPQADIPVVEMSLLDSLDPQAHVNIGRALAPLRDQGVLIIGSGLSFHNFDYFFARTAAKRAEGVAHSALFDKALVETLAPSPSCARARAVCEEEQEAALVGWAGMPSALQCHPRGQEEHFLPLHVAFGAGLLSPEAVYPGAGGEECGGATRGGSRRASNKHFPLLSFGEEGSKFKLSNFEFN